MNFTVTGVEKTLKNLNKVGKVPAKVLTAAVKPGAKIIQATVKTNAPVDTGLLRRSIKLKAEKRKTGKKVYQIKFISDKLAKVGKNGKRSFYPASQEYGWEYPEGVKHPGKFFMKNALKQTRYQVKKTIIEGLVQGIESVVR